MTDIATTISPAITQSTRSSWATWRNLHKLAGLIAWLGWSFVHVWYLIGFNRFTVMLTWIWSYITWRRGSRLITTHIARRIDLTEDPAVAQADGIARETSILPAKPATENAP